MRSALSPFAFYASLLGADQARKRFLSRLGPEANDVIDEFLNLALAYESRETPSLQGFAAWLRTASAEIKRDMEIARDEVRVMTVHGAKGLEAPIVILADTTTEPQGPIQHQPRLLNLPAQDAAPDTPDRIVWVPAKHDDIAPTAAARATSVGEAVDEYRRLLYVAMTRAADRLVICGSVGLIRRPQLLLVRPHRRGAEAALHRGAGRRRRRHGAALSQDAVEARDAVAVRRGGAATEPRTSRPDWLTRAAPHETAPFAPLSPSQLYDETAPIVRAGGAARRQAMARGVVMHRLLQSLPAIAPAQRARGRAPLPRAARAATSPPRSARNWRARRSRWSSIPASPRCSRRRAGPRFRSSGAWRTAARPAPSPASSTAWWSPTTRS